MTSKRLLLILVAAIAVGLGSMFLFTGSLTLDGNEQASSSDTINPPTEEAVVDQEALEKIAKMIAIIQEQYVEDIDEEQLVQGAIDGMLESLDDPYSVYMDQETANQFTESLDSSFEGIGAEVSMTDGRVTIVVPFRESPAEQAGLQPNDKIMEIDGETTEGLSLYEAVSKIRGEKGTTVTLSVERAGASELLTIPVVRDDIPIETVRVSTFEKDGKTIGMLDITSFSVDTAERFEEGLAELEAQGIDGLLIDVRSNPGGYLDSVEKIGKLIIPGGEPIVQIQDRDGERIRYVSSLNETKPYPIVGLTDRSSASASEILSAALSEAGGYDVVGETTFGKGTVQQTIQLGDGSQLKLSLFRWLTSAGNDVDGKGVDPTVEVKQPDYFYSAPLTGDETLRLEMMNEQIRSAQTMLKGLGHEAGRSDGYFDEQTEQAVRAFQQAQGLAVTGEIDEETAGLLQQTIIEEVRDEANDKQLQTAIELVTKQAQD
ncbi:S41 family peptidase [Bacillus sp. FJAT-45037]|uniref:S41 family peptidase n=1 Tax=Bacillus sp. FJAT-45037 TaxID=2011007 RepID=UPI000C246BB4|nr:S41 family peptidase [Bacillus sp. FJAT-45037]